MEAPDTLEQMQAEFERLALAGEGLAASYGLLLIQRQAETEKKLAETKAALQQAIINFLAIGGGYWNSLPPLPPLPPVPVDPVRSSQ